MLYPNCTRNHAIKAHFHQVKKNFHADRKFSENIIVKSFQLQNFFPTENLCRPITFYKILFLRKIFLSAGNGPLYCYYLC